MKLSCSVLQGHISQHLPAITHVEEPSNLISVMTPKLQKSWLQKLYDFIDSKSEGDKK